MSVCLPLMALALVAGPAEASQPADGTVGSAGGRTPAGQSPDDHNRGRNCDANPGAGDGNPAFGACTALGADGGGDPSGTGTGGMSADVVTDATPGDDMVTGGSTGGDIVTGGTPSDVVTSGSGADEAGISWIVITRPVVEIVAAATEVPMTKPVFEFAVITPVFEQPAAAPVLEGSTTTPVVEGPAPRPVVERALTTPVQPAVPAPAAERALTTPVQPAVPAPAAERALTTPEQPAVQAPASRALHTPVPRGSSTQLGSAPGFPSQSSTSSAVVPAALPFTGFATGPVVLLGAGLALIGLVLTLAGRRPRTR